MNQPAPHMQQHSPEPQAYAAPTSGSPALSPSTPPETLNRPAASQTSRLRSAPRNVAAGQIARIEDLSGKSIQPLIIAAGLFIIFFIILASMILLGFRASHNEAQARQSLHSTTDIAQAASMKLDAQLSWIDKAISTRGSAKQIVDLVARGNNIQGALVVSADNTILAATPNAESAGPSIPVADFPKAGVKILSLIAENGAVSPVIVRRAGTAYLAVILTPGSLVDYRTHHNALILTSGSIVDAPADMGRIGGLAYLGLSAERLNAIKNKNPVAHDVNGNTSWLSIRTIPNSDSVAVVTAVPKSLPKDWIRNLLTFALMICSVFLLCWFLIKNLISERHQVEKNGHFNLASEERYRVALEGNNGGIFEINLSENTAYITESLASLLGLVQKEQVLTLPQFLALFSEGDREQLYSLSRRAHISGEFNVDLNVAHLPLVLETRGKPTIRGANMDKIVIGLAMNVTEQRGAAIRLQAAEARLSEALTAMNDSFVLWDPRGRLVVWNLQFENFFGFKPGNLHQGMDRATIEYHAHAVIADIHNIEAETAQDLHLIDGRWIRYQDVTTADGSIVGVGTDLSGIRTREHQLQQNEAALQKTIDVLRKSQFRIVELAESYEQEKIRAEEANQSKSNFLANMSHELRTPLNAINGFSDIMCKEMFGPLGDPRYKEYVSDILFSGQHLLSLINDILDMSKIEAGKMTLNHEIIQINDMINQVIRIVRGRAEDNRLKLIYEAEELPEIEADPRQVKQVLLNLLTNAIKFTPEGGVVSCSVTSNSAGLIVEIADTGIGIAQEDIDRLAKPFEQIDSQHSRQHEGTGLGLALSKSLIELHGGNFRIESELGQGTKAIFTLPKTAVTKNTQTNTGSEVGDEISRLAHDIAEVLTDNPNAPIDAAFAAPSEVTSVNTHPYPQPQPAAAVAPPMAAPPAPPQPSAPMPPPRPQNVA